MPSMVYLQCPWPEALSAGDLMRHCFYDGPGEAAKEPYNPKFFEDFAKKFLYTRFWEPDTPGGNKTLYMCCGYGFTAVVQPGFFGELIREHFRHHYFQLGLLAHFHRASLLRFSRRFNEVLLCDPDEHSEKTRALRREFATFVSTSWFHEVSNQEQGRELFELWTRHLGSERLMKDILTEVAALDEVLDLDRQRELAENQKNLAERVDRLTILLYVMAAATFVVAFLDTETVRKSIERNPTFHPFIWKWSLLWAAVMGLALSLIYFTIVRGGTTLG